MEESDKIIYHYTSLEGLLGIIERKSIWATNILYLNDASELNYAKDLFREQLLDFQKTLRNAFMPEYGFFQQLIENMEYFIVGNDFFVCSFSGEGDLLSQWRGYCPDGSGFSLGFKFSKLEECAKQQGFLIRPCSYDKSEQISKLKKCIEETSLRFRNKIDPDWEELSIQLIIKFIEIGPTFKHPKFEAENEQRIIAKLYPISSLGNNFYKLIRFRPGKSMVVPYIEIPLPKEGDIFIINKIVVGPTHDPLLSKASVEMLLRSKKVIFDEVLYSTIPYRNW